MAIIQSKDIIYTPQVPLFWLSQNKTEVTFRYNVQLRNIFFEISIGWIVYWFLQRDIKNRLQALKKSAETTDTLNRLPKKHE